MESSLRRGQLLVCDLGVTRYADAWDLQRDVFQLRSEDAVPDVLLLTEHEHVYTIGKSGKDNHLLAQEASLREKNIDVFHIDRGGDITYHGPGQLVAYPILDLNNYYLDVHRYLRDLEEVIIQALATFGVQAARDSRYTGVWVDGRKIAAIGVKVSRWITMHGVAVNVKSDLRYFDGIVPCGICDRQVTSLEKILLKPVDAKDFAKRFVEAFEAVFSVQTTRIDVDSLLERLGHHRMDKETCLQ